MPIVSYSPLSDGRDHINIYSKGQTRLGRLLSNFAHTPVLIDGIQFQSIEGYWYWLATGRRHNLLCKLYGFKAKQEGKKFPRIDIYNFQQLICTALRIKVNTYHEIRDLLTQSSLPFTHYYVFNNKVVSTASEWVIEEWVKIRQELKAG